MAIKVIEYGKRTTRCNYCESKLQYEKEDVETMQTGMNGRAILSALFAEKRYM